MKGTVQDAPANGGSGFAESTESDAFCPAGTVVIGTASHSNDQGVEAGEVLVATTTQVAGFFDNFNNIDEPNNFVIAICAKAASVSDPSGLRQSSARRVAYYSRGGAFSAAPSA